MDDVTLTKEKELTVEKAFLDPRHYEIPRPFIRDENVLICQHLFPYVYYEDDILVKKSSRDLNPKILNNAFNSQKEDLGKEGYYIQRLWFLKAEKDEIIDFLIQALGLSLTIKERIVNFLIEILGVSPTIKWSGCRIRTSDKKDEKLSFIFEIFISNTKEENKFFSSDDEYFCWADNIKR